MVEIDSIADALGIESGRSPPEETVTSLPVVEEAKDTENGPTNRRCPLFRAETVRFLAVMENGNATREWNWQFDSQDSLQILEKVSQRSQVKEKQH